MEAEIAVLDMLLAHPELREDPDAAFRLVSEALNVRAVASDEVRLEEDFVRFVCISDTHSKHRQLQELPMGDVLLHAGDFTFHGKPNAVKDFLDWFKAQPHPIKIFIAGNHDLTLHEGFYEANWSRWHEERLDDEKVREMVEECEGVEYLRDSSIDVEGYHIYGSPWSPVFHDWAFNLRRGAECAEAWEKIPQQTDVLITHGPPLGIGDHCRSHLRAGCVDLLREVLGRVKPLVHMFGHIHEDPGIFECCSSQTRFVNASTCTLRYRPANPPVVFDLPRRARREEGEPMNGQTDKGATSSANESGDTPPPRT